MSPSIGTMSVVSDSTGSVWASRLRRPRWTDPRLLVGLALVAIATVAGSRVVAAADDTTAVWAVGGPVQAGDPVQPDALVATSVRIGAGDETGPYLPAAQAPPDGVFTRDLTAGELVPAGAVGDETPDDGADLSLAVELGSAPADLAAGDLVDVWAVPPQPAGTTARQQAAARVLAGVPVLSVAEPAATVGGTTQQVLVRVDSPPDQLGVPLTRLSAGTVVLVRVGG